MAEKFDKNTKISVFRSKQIRKVIYKNEWWFVVEDVVLALIDSADAKQYVKRMRLRDPELAKGWVQIVHTLSVATGGGEQKMSCANTRESFVLFSQFLRPKRNHLSAGWPK